MRTRTILAAALGAAILAGAYGVAAQMKTADSRSSADSDIVLTGNEYAIIVNGSGLSLSTPARLEGSTMLVPVRNIAEALGANVTYNPHTESVTAVQGDISVTFRIGSKEVIRNGKTIELSTATVLDGQYTMVPVRFFSETFGTVVKWDGTNRLVTIDHESRLLPALGSYKNLQKLLKENQTLIERGGMAFSGRAEAATAVAAPAAAAVKTTDAGATAPADYSATNVQVDGVDEADVVKTDGEYIYRVNRDQIVIARAYPADSLSLVSSISMSGLQMQPMELYVDGDRLTVIGHSYEAIGAEASPSPMMMEKKMVAPARRTAVKTVVFDISSRAQPKAVKEVETEGSYVTSRKIGSHVYVISNQYADRYGILNGGQELPAPAYRDSAQTEAFIRADYSQIRYFPDSPMDSYMLVAGIDTAQPDKKAQVSVYLGSAQNVYASEKNLFVAVTQYTLTPRVMGEGTSTSKERVTAAPEVTTNVFKFLMDEGQVRFTAEGKVPGTILNQFSMDEHGGYFRIATTKGEMWRNDEFTSKNNVYVMDQSLNVTGKIEDIAPGERIYSVRFMGGRGYMVTFKQVDPLFVLDLSDPYKPGILGKLKIPGYSDYLHPYDETHLIGFGKDAEAGKGGTAYYQGMKIAMFDVSDVANPKELFKTGIGDRGTDSELLRNHKALLFSKEKSLMAFPVTVMEIPDERKNAQDPSTYGQFAFQGAYVYRVDLKEGFQLRGTLTHMSEEELMKAGTWHNNGGSSIDRILYIGNRLYTLSPSEIRANDLDTLQELKRLSLP